MGKSLNTLDESGEIQLIDVESRRKLDTLVGDKGIVTQIKFTNEKELFSSARDKKEN